MQLKIIYTDLPQNILFIFTTIHDKKYGIINENANFKDKQLYKEACHFLYEHNGRNITVCKDSVFAPEWVQLFDEYINRKAVLGKELFSLATYKLKRMKEEIA